MNKKLAVLALATTCVGILGLGIAVFLRARNTSASNACINNLREIDAIKQQWAIEEAMTTNSIPTWNNLRPYFSRWQRQAEHDRITCPQGGIYTLGRVADDPMCSIGGPEHTLP